MIGSLVGTAASCLWQAVTVVADVLFYGAGMMGSVGT